MVLLQPIVALADFHKYSHPLQTSSSFYKLLHWFWLNFP